ncbi:MAG: zinc ribbon domain-containing protein [Desulfurivibrio sp.]|nr:zinc ribbon domain-containing protein [Desulfurivibrio sp.]
MPIYEYECQSCRKITEARQSLREAPLSACPECDGELTKIISQTSFTLKGGGWYADGYSSPAADPRSHHRSAKAAPATSARRLRRRRPVHRRPAGPRKRATAPPTTLIPRILNVHQCRGRRQRHC